MKIKDLARIAGVSPSTVSKIMHQKDDNISAETREHVLSIAKQYNYVPAQSLTSPDVKTMTLGVILKTLKNPAPFLSGILEAANRAGYFVMVCESGNSAEKECRNIHRMISARVDGVLWEPVLPVVEENKLLLEEGQIPFLFFRSPVKNSIRVDYTELGYQAARVLVENHHTSIACILRKKNPNEEFLEGYRKCLFDHQIKLDNHLILTLEDMDLSNLLTRRTFTGLVVSDHQDALLFYEMCKKRNYTIPYDFSVVSLIDDYELPQTYPPISVIPVPHTECGRHALTSLVKIIEAKGGKSEPFTALPVLTDLSSVGAPYLSASQKVIVVGSTNMDRYLNFDQLPHTGKAVRTASSATYPGGKCLNQSVGLSRLGHFAVPISCLGDDVDTDTIFDYLHGYTMDKTGLKRCRNEQTGQAYIFVQQDGNSMISIMSGANNALTPQIIALNEELFANARCCLMQTEVPTETLLTACEICKDKHIRTVLKPSACSVLPDKLLSMIDMIIPNHSELFEIVPDAADINEAVDRLLDSGIGTVIVTLGADGSYIKSREFGCECRIPARDIISIDSSGACDAFISALVSYMMYGYDLVTSAKIATCSAALEVTRQGTTSSLPDRHTLEAYIHQVEPELLNKPIS